ncbi:hypothetical protein LUZ60_009242 [Juncus effusus]|nr:hypothetical protein LUZ60_009242 [Juncus effusus]
MAKKRKISAASGSAPAAAAAAPKQVVVKEEPKAEEKPQEEQALAITDPTPLQKEEIETEETTNSPNEDTDMVTKENEDQVEQEQEEEDDQQEESDPESLQSLLEVFPKDQLVEMLRDAAVAHKDVLDQVRRAADMDPTQRKVFVHGLGWDTTTETLTSAFASYGEIEDLKVVMDKNTGKCKGYGFVLFSKRTGAKAALKEPQKKIGNRTAACQLASVGPTSSNPATPGSQGPTPSNQSEYTQRKIFVSNVGPDVDPQKLLQFFKQFGEIEEGPLGLDKSTGKPKGFALFVYKSVDGARKALREPHKKFEGMVVHCQRAIDGVKGNGKPGFGKQGFGGRSSVPDYAPPVQVPAGMPGASHLLPPSVSQSAVPAVPGAPGINPTLGHALTAFIATQLGALGQGGPGAPGAGYGYGAPPGGYGGPGAPGGGGVGRGGGAGGGYMGGI